MQSELSQWPSKNFFFFLFDGDKKLLLENIVALESELERDGLHSDKIVKAQLS